MLFPIFVELKIEGGLFVVVVRDGCFPIGEEL